MLWYPTSREFSGGHRSDALYQGTTLVGPLRPIKDLGFSPCALSLLRIVFAQAFPAAGAMAGAEAQFSFCPLLPD